MKALLRLTLAGCVAVVVEVQGQPFRLPTANRALFESGGEARFFVGTPGRTWKAGTYGCVRSDGYQLHEGIDIAAVKRDAKGEPRDDVLATADGVVVYVNRRSSLSSYGNYVVVQHQVDGVDVFSLYAHLAQVRVAMRPGTRVRGGEVIGTMGRTTNTRTQISKERAHLHFELGLRLHDRFAQWRRERHPEQRNDHGEWNGQNLIGLDAGRLLADQARLGANFGLPRFIRDQTELCRAQVQATKFPWLRRYPMLIESNPTVPIDNAAGMELALNYAGLPFRAIARTSSQMKSKGRPSLISVNEREQAERPCGKLVVRRGRDWVLAYNGERLLDLLTF